MLLFQAPSSRIRPEHLNVLLFDLLKLYVFVQTYDMQAVKGSVVSTIYARPSNDREIWANLGSDTGQSKYLVDHSDPSTRLCILVTRALAYHMFPVAPSKQKFSMPFAAGGRAISLGENLSRYFPTDD